MFINNIKLHLFFILALISCSFVSRSQTLDTMTDFIPSASLWGYAFGDYAFKGNADTVGNAYGSPGRGGSNQYAKIPQNTNFFQFRRIYLGVNYYISPKFTAEFLLAAEDDFAPGSIGNQSSTGDVFSTNNPNFVAYVKLANIRWKNIFSGTDLVVGQASTPSFPLMSEAIWGYRSIERTITDNFRTPSFDLGISLQGHFDADANYGYNVMMGNGNGAKPAVSSFKWYYADVWAKFMDKKLIFDLYQDYYRYNWSAPIAGAPSDGDHQDRNMTKLFVAYTKPKFTIGLEAFSCTFLGGIQANTAQKTYYLTTVATGISLFARGPIYKDKLGFYVRYDNFDPSHKINEVTSNPEIIAYSTTTNSSNYDPTTKQQMFIYGLDYTPVKNVHIMPNVWTNAYKCSLSSKYVDLGLNPKANAQKGTDLVYRLTIYYTYGKK